MVYEWFMYVYVESNWFIIIFTVQDCHDLRILRPCVGKSPALRLWLAAACRVELLSAKQKEICEHSKCRMRRRFYDN